MRMIVDPKVLSICPECVKPIMPLQDYETYMKMHYHTNCLVRFITGRREGVVEKQEKGQEPPPCSMDVTDGEC